MRNGQKFYQALLGWLGCVLVLPSFGQSEIGEWKRECPDRATPVWMNPVHWENHGGVQSWMAEVHPSNVGHSLLLSVVFRPHPDGFVRVIWKDASQAVTLASDLTEGDPALHQRSLFLDPNYVGHAGELWIEAKGAVLEKVSLEWVEAVGWASTGKEGFVQTGSGRLLRTEDLYGDAYQPASSRFSPRAVEIMLQAGPIPIHERSLRLHVPVAAEVLYARLEFWVAGLAPAESLLFSLNEGSLQELHPEVPGLEDPGYLYDPASGQTEMGGWRRVTLFLEGKYLPKGSNTLLLFPDCRVFQGKIFVRDLRIQAVFPEQRADPSAPAPLDSSEEGTSRLPGAVNAGLSFRSEGVGLRP